MASELQGSRGEDAARGNGRTQAERTALSDRRMLDAAIELICTHGTHQTTLQALGEASGYSRGLVTYRFGSKAGLFEAVVKHVSQQWLETLNEAVGKKGGLQAVIATADAYYQFVLDAPMPIRTDTWVRTSPRRSARLRSSRKHERALRGSCMRRCNRPRLPRVEQIPYRSFH